MSQEESSVSGKKKRKGQSFKARGFTVVDKLEEGYMSIPSFRDYLAEKYKVTSENQEITIIYTHSLIDMKRLPLHWGGNLLDIVIYSGKKFVKVSDKLREKLTPGRKKGQKDKKARVGKKKATPRPKTTFI